MDECDEMLNMGFVEDVEKILTAVDDKDNIQTLLFSATLPAWVRQITKRFLKASHKVVDLIGDDKIKVHTYNSFVQTALSLACLSSYAHCIGVDERAPPAVAVPLDAAQHDAD